MMGTHPLLLERVHNITMDKDMQKEEAEEN